MKIVQKRVSIINNLNVWGTRAYRAVRTSAVPTVRIFHECAWGISLMCTGISQILGRICSEPSMGNY